MEVGSTSAAAEFMSGALIQDRYKPLWDDVTRQFSVPLFVLRGDDSEVLLDEDAQELADRLPRGRWVRIPDAGHTIQGDNPLAMVEALNQFCDEISYGCP